MKLKTSFFNTTLLHKNVIRFSPIWIAYLAVWSVIMPMLLATQLFNDRLGWHPDSEDVMRGIFNNLSGIGPAFACLYGLVVAMAVFSYLYTARSVSLMHSLPIRRSGLFLTNYISGLLFIIVPNAVVALLTALVTAAGDVFCPGMILAWFLGMSAMDLFFFSFAVFIAMFTGHILVLPVFYGILNVLAIVLYQTVVYFISQFLYGMDAYGLPDGSVGLVIWLTPLMKIYRHLSMDMAYPDGALPNTGADYSATIYGGEVLIAYAVIGVVLALLAYLVYRSHRSETAGDVVSVGWAKVLFRYGVALTAAFTIGQGLYEMSALSGAAAELLCMIVVAVLGFLIAQMLLNKTFKVVKQSLRGSAICAVLVLAVFAAAVLDVTGYTRRVPTADQVQEVSVSINAYDYSNATLTEPDSIEKVLAIHQYAVDHKWELQNANSYGGGYINGEDAGYYAEFEVNYTLKNGTYASRRYTLPLKQSELHEDGTPAAMVQDLVDTAEYKAKDALEELLADNVRMVGAVLTYYEGRYDAMQEYTFNKMDTQTLYDAMMEDAAAGRLPRINLVDYPEDYSETQYVNELQFEYRYANQSSRNNYWCCIRLTTDMTSTMQALEKLGVLNDRLQLMTDAEYDRVFSEKETSWPETESTTVALR